MLDIFNRITMKLGVLLRPNFPKYSVLSKNGFKNDHQNAHKLISDACTQYKNLYLASVMDFKGALSNRPNHEYQLRNRNFIGVISFYIYNAFVDF